MFFKITTTLSEKYDDYDEYTNYPCHPVKDPKITNKVQVVTLQGFLRLGPS